MRILKILNILLIILAFFISFYFYKNLDVNYAIHWDMSWNVDFYTNKWVWLFFIPILSFVLFLFFLLFPKIDPLRNIKKFIFYYNLFLFFVLVFLSYIHYLILLWNLWYEFNMNIMVASAVWILFFFMWIILPHSKRNWFLWVRTPWTLSSDKVWDKTNKLAWVLFKIYWFIVFFSFLAWEHFIYFIIIPLIVFILSLFIYSYVEYAEELI